MGGNPYIIGAYVFSVIFSFEGDMSFDGAKIQNAFLHAIERPIFLRWKVKCVLFHVDAAVLYLLWWYG